MNLIKMNLDHCYGAMQHVLRLKQLSAFFVCFIKFVELIFIFKMCIRLSKGWETIGEVWQLCCHEDKYWQLTSSNVL